jgi:hypothetical protein
MTEKTRNLAVENSLGLHEILDYLGDIFEVTYHCECEYDEAYVAVSHSLKYTT